jgi:hypothetical protein
MCFFEEAAGMLNESRLKLDNIMVSCIQWQTRSNENSTNILLPFPETPLQTQ